MSRRATGLAAHAGSCIPAVARLPLGPRDGEVTYERAGIRLAARTMPLPLPGERSYGTFASVTTVHVAVDEDGRPPTEGAAGPHTPTRAASGSGVVLVTDRRTVVVVSEGDSVLGKAGDSIGKVVVATLRHHDVDALRLEAGRRVYGNVRSARLQLLSLDGLGAVTLYDVATRWDGARWVNDQDGLGSVMDAVVAATTDAVGLPPRVLRSS